MRNILRNLAANPNTQVLVGFMWSFSAILVKDLTSKQGIDIFLLSSVRSLIGLCFLLPLVFIKWEDADQQRPAVSSLVKSSGIHSLFWVKLLGSSSLVANTFLLCWAFQHTSALTPVFMHYSGLLLVAPISRFVLDYTPSKREWVSCALTIAGLTALVFHGLAFDKPIVTLVSVGVGLSQLIGQLCLAWLSKNDEIMQRETSVKQSQGGQCLLISDSLTVLLGTSISLLTASSYLHISLYVCGELALLGVLTWGIPNFMALLAMRTKALVSLGLLWLCDPVFVAIWPVLVGQDPIPPPLSWLGAILIVTALIAQHTGLTRHQKIDLLREPEKLTEAAIK